MSLVIKNNYLIKMVNERLWKKLNFYCVLYMHYTDQEGLTGIITCLFNIKFNFVLTRFKHGVTMKIGPQMTCPGHVLLFCTMTGYWKIVVWEFRSLS